MKHIKDYLDVWKTRLDDLEIISLAFKVRKMQERGVLSDVVANTIIVTLAESI